LPLSLPLHSKIKITIALLSHAHHTTGEPKEKQVVVADDFDDDSDDVCIQRA
jgi:hypothetical protein